MRAAVEHARAGLMADKAALGARLQHWHQRLLHASQQVGPPHQPLIPLWLQYGPVDPPDSTTGATHCAVCTQKLLQRWGYCLWSTRMILCSG